MARYIPQPYSDELTRLDADGGITPADLATELADYATVAYVGATFAPLSHGHSMGDISGLSAALADKSNVGHGHVIADVSGLQPALDGKAATAHGHVIADTTGLQAALDAKLNLSGGTVTGQVLFSGTGSGLGLAQLQSASSNWFIYSGGTFQSPLFNCNGWFGMVDGASGGVQFYSGHAIVWSGTGTSGSLTRNSLSGDVGLYRNASGQLDVRGDSGLRVRNLANSADAALACGTITASGNVIISSSGPSFESRVSGYNNPFTFGGALSADLTGRFVGVSGAGLVLQGYSTVSNSVAFRMQGHARQTSPTLPPFVVESFKSNGSDGRTSLSSTEWAYGFYNGAYDASGSALLSIRGDGFMALMGLTSSFPAIKRNGTAINFRLADDSADAPITASNGTFSGLVSVGTYTVATLPSAAANPGRIAQVTDSSVTANGSAVAGGGSNRVLVYSNGSTWDVAVA